MATSTWQTSPSSSSGSSKNHSSVIYVFVRKSHELNRKAFGKAGVIKFNMGPKSVYMVSGASNVQNMFRSGHGISDDIMLRTAAESVWNLTREDTAKLVNDKSGRAKIPNPGYEHLPASERYW